MHTWLRCRTRIHCKYTIITMHTNLLICKTNTPPFLFFFFFFFFHRCPHQPFSAQPSRRFFRYLKSPREPITALPNHVSRRLGKSPAPHPARGRESFLVDRHSGASSGSGPVFSTASALASAGKGPLRRPRPGRHPALRFCTQKKKGGGATPLFVYEAVTSWFSHQAAHLSAFHPKRQSILVFFSSSIVLLYSLLPH